MFGVWIIIEWETHTWIHHTSRTRHNLVNTYIVCSYFSIQEHLFYVQLCLLFDLKSDNELNDHYKGKHNQNKTTPYPKQLTLYPKLLVILSQNYVILVLKLCEISKLKGVHNFWNLTKILQLPVLYFKTQKKNKEWRQNNKIQHFHLWNRLRSRYFLSGRPHSSKPVKIKIIYIWVVYIIIKFKKNNYQKKCEETHSNTIRILR